MWSVYTYIINKGTDMVRIVVNNQQHTFDGTWEEVKAIFPAAELLWETD